jgi:ABC-type microcin C transport system permease subunit YejB
MKTKVLIASAVAAVAALIPVASASAGTYWTWSPAYTASQVEGSTLSWKNEADDYVTHASCRGVGRAHRDGGVAQFYRLNCYVETADGEQFVIRVKANGEHAFKYRFLRWA